MTRDARRFKQGREGRGRGEPGAPARSRRYENRAALPLDEGEGLEIKNGKRRIRLGRGLAFDNMGQIQTAKAARPLNLTPAIDLTTLDPSTATAAQVATRVNAINSAYLALAQTLQDLIQKLQAAEMVER